MMTEQKDFIMPTTIVDDDDNEDDLGYSDSIKRGSVTSSVKQEVRKKMNKIFHNTKIIYIFGI